MVQPLVTLATLFVGLTPGSAIVGPIVPDTSRYEAVFNQLMALEADPSRTGTVDNITIRRGTGALHLEAGTLSFLSPVDGQTMGAVFVGQGTFTFTAPGKIERAQLNRFYDADSIHVPIRGVALLFADSTAGELTASTSFGAAPAHRDARNTVRDALRYLSDDDSRAFNRSLMSAALNGLANGVFYAHIVRERGDPIFFMVDPYDAEQIILARPAKGTRERYRETVSQFPIQGDRVDPAPDTVPNVVRLGNYVIESTIEDNLDFSAAAAFEMSVTDPDHRWVPLDLYSELEVDSARWDDGTPASFFRGKKSGTIWVDAAPAVTAGAPRRLHLYYEGNLIERVRNWMVYVKSSAGWYPRGGDRTRAAFDMTFHSPERYVLVSVGDRVEDSVSNKRRTTRWVTPNVNHVTFNLGEFEEHRFADPRIPPVTLHVAQKAHEALSGEAALADMYIPLQDNIGEMVGADLTNSLAFYQRVFGAAPVQQFTGTEIPYLHGQAFPGLVLLSWITFQWTAEKGYDDIFRAHEVAHQWWGIGVDVASYHDRWLSEGMSDFAGLWYMETVRMDRDMYEKRLIEMKEDILERHDKTGPLWLGDRLATSEHPEDYQTMVYKKGAWVVHMLRYLMRNLDTLDEGPFVRLMQDFYASNVGGRATTEGFKETVERHMGISMDWFFDQWVYGTEIPKFHVAYRYEDTPDGQVQATVRVRTENVPEGFKALVPLHLDFGSDGWASLRILVGESESTIDLPLMPKKPVRIVFNNFEAVLAEVDYEGW